MVSSNKIVYSLGALFIFLVVVSSFSFMPIKLGDWKNYTTIIGVNTIFIYFLYLNNFKLNFNLTLQKLPLVLLFILGFLSFFWSNFLDFSINKFILWQVVFFAFVMISSIKWDNATIKKLLLYLVISGVIISIIGISQYLFNIPSESLLPQVAFPASTFGNKNYAMHFLVLLIPLSIYLFLTTNKLYQKYLFSLLISIILIYIFYTKTRGAWLGVLLEFILIFIYLFFNRENIRFDKHKIISGGLGFVVIVFFMHLSADGFVSMFDTIQTQFSKTVGDVANDGYERYAIYNNAIDMITESPVVGTGLGSYYFNNINFTHLDTFKKVHNDVLELGVELGLVGLLLFVSFILSLLYLWIKSLKSDNSLILSILIIALSGSLLNAMFSMPYQSVLPLFIAGMYLGLFYNLTSNYQKVINIDFNKIITIILAVLVFFSLIITINQLKVENDINNHKFNSPSFVYHPNYYHLTTTLTDQYMSHSDYIDKAEQLIHWNLTKFPNNIVVLKQKLTLLLQQKNYKQAENYAQELYFLEKDGSYFGLLGLIDIYLNTDKQPLALKYYNELKSFSQENLKKYPIYYQALYESANYLGLTDDVVKFLHLYIKHNPTYNGLKYVKLLDEIYLASKVGDIRSFRNNYQILKSLPHSELIKDRAYYDMLDRAANGLMKYSTGKEMRVYKQDIKEFEKYLHKFGLK